MSAVLAVAALVGWTRGGFGSRVGYTGPKGCEARDGVWRHVGADVAGMWVIHNGYGLEVVYHNGAKVPEITSWRYVRCTDTTATVLYTGSTLIGEPALHAGAEITQPERIVEGVMTWRNPDTQGRLGPELRGERIR